MLASGMCLNYGYDAFYVRKQRKKYGLKKLIEGNLTSPCVIVEDVLSTGESLRYAVKTVLAQGVKIKMIIVLVNRCDKKISFGRIPLYEIYTKDDLL
jgi:orotate phosphoribosyltransferase